jgi:polar amino acid transport system permease protein
VSRPLLDQAAHAPPDSRRRTVSIFRPRALPAIVGAAVALGITVLTWVQLRHFDESLHVNGRGLIAARVIEVALALAVLSVPFYAVRAVARMLRARRLAVGGAVPDARISMEDSRDDLWFVAGFGLMALIVAFCAFLLSANDGRVRTVLFDFDLIWRSRHALWRGFWYNVKLFVVAQALVLVWALLVAVVRQLPGRAFAPVRTLAIAYTDVFRGVPAIIVIYLIVLGFGLAGVPPFDRLSRDSQLFWLSVLALVLVYGAYVAEVYRAGLESIHWSQAAAARSLGLSQWQTLRYVVIPQAVRRIIPPLLNDFVALQKDTALVSIVGVTEVLNNAQLLKNRYFNLSPVTGAALFFLVITIPCTRIVDYMIKRDQRKMRAQ